MHEYGGLTEDMRSASTGLAHLPEEATASSRPIPIVPEVLPGFLPNVLLHVRAISGVSS